MVFVRGATVGNWGRGGHDVLRQQCRSAQRARTPCQSRRKDHDRGGPDVSLIMPPNSMTHYLVPNNKLKQDLEATDEGAT